MLFQEPLPSAYDALSDREILERIKRRKVELDGRLVILGHHYQQDDVIAFADFTGDSLKLSQIAAKQTEAEFVVFCGVHFMAESADILTDDSVTVILPDLSAGCSMADMAEIDQVEEAWDVLNELADGTIVPITYVNSAASIKAFCGEHGGACCTSSNAVPVLEWALRRGDRVLFLPDQHLGRNTAFAMGYPLDEMCVYDPRQRDGGLTQAQARAAKFFLWKGHCSVHQLFTPADCDAIRRTDPDCTILVHPECSWEVVQRADLVGSTEYIINAVREAPPESRWAIGTEIHLINRLAGEFENKFVRSLASVQCLCTTMYRVDPKHLLFVLDALAEGRVVNQIRVDAKTKRHALTALDRMLANTAPAAVSAS